MPLGLPFLGHMVPHGTYQQCSAGWLCTTWIMRPGGYRGVLADRAMVRSLGWVHRRLLAIVVTSASSGSSDLGMHLVAPIMMRH